MANKGIVDELVGQEAFNQLNKLNTELEKNAKSMQALIDEAARLQKLIENSTGFAELAKLLTQTEKLTRNVNAADRERQRILNQRNTLYERLNQASSKEAQELENLRRQLRDYNREQRNRIQQDKAAEGSIEQMRAKLNLLRQSYDKLSAEIRSSDAGRKAAEDIRKLHEEISKLEQETGRNQRNVGNYFDAIKSGIKSVLGALGVVTGIRALINVFKNAYSTIVDFEQANANLASILGTNRKEIKDLTDDAKRLGAATEYTASQVTSLQTELAKLGFTRKEILNATEPILQFATATGSNLAEAAALAGASLRAFGLDTGETTRVVATMAVGTNKSALNFGFLQTAMSKVAPVAKGLNFSIEDTVTLLGALANSGFDASTAATSTRSILLSLADGSSKLNQAIGKPVKSLDDLIVGLQKLNKEGISLEETLDLSDKRSVAALRTFIDTSDSLKQLRDSVTDVSEELDIMHKERLNTVEGSTRLLESAWEGLMLAFSSSAGVFKQIIDWLTSVVNALHDVVLGVEGVRAQILDKETIRRSQEAQKEVRGLIESYAAMPHNANKSIEEVTKMAVNDFVKQQELLLERAQKTLDKLAPLRTFGGKEIRVADTQNKEQVRQVQDNIKLIQSEIDAAKELLNVRKNLNTTAGELPEGGLDNDEKRKLKERQKLASDIAKAENDVKKLQVKTLADYDQQIYNNQEVSFEERLQAAWRYQTGLDEAAEIQKNYEIALAKKTYEDKKALGEATAEDAELMNQNIALAEAKYREQTAQNEAKSTDILAKIYKDYQDNITNDLKEGLKVRAAEINKNRSDELAALSKQYSEGQIRQEEYEKQKRAIELKYAQESIDEEIKMFEELLKLFTLTEGQRLTIQRSIDQLRLKSIEETNKSIAKDDEDTAKKREQAEKKLAEVRKQLLKESLNLVREVVSGQISARIEEYDAEIEKINERKEALLEALEEQGMSETVRAEEQQRIEEEAARQTEQLEEKKKQAKLQQAVFDKAWGASEVAINTAVAIMKAATSVPPPFNAPLIAAMTALGAVQLAAVLAKPIPKYAYGVTDHPGGPAIMGDAGKSELVIEPGGKVWATADKPTLYDLPKHSTVLPDLNFPSMDELGSVLNFETQKIEKDKELVLNVDFKRLEAAQVESTKMIVRAIEKNKAQFSVNLNANGFWSIVINKEKTIKNISRTTAINK